MSEPNVKVNVTANSSKFVRTINDVKAETKGLVNFMHEQSTDLRGALLTGLGIGAIGEMVSSAMEFAKETQKSANEMGVTLDRAAQLNRIMEQIGKSSDTLTESMSKVQAYMSKAFNDASKLGELKKFGITGADFNNFNFDNVLRKALEASKQMSNAEAQEGLSQIFGKGFGPDLLYKREEILAQPSDVGINKQQLQEIVEATAKFKELKESIGLLILRGIIPLIDWMQKLSLNKQDSEDTYSARWTRAYQLYQDQGGDMKRLQRREHIADWLPVSGESKLIAQFGPDITKEVVKEIKPITSALDAYNKKIAELSKQDTNNNAGGKITPIKEQSLGNLATNAFIRIGGFMGADLNYRLERIQLEQLNYLKIIADNTTPSTTSTSPVRQFTNNPINAGVGM